MYSNELYVPNDLANCPFPPEGAHCKPEDNAAWTDDALDAAIFWVVMREYLRAQQPSTKQQLDNAFYDAWINCMTQGEFRSKYPFVANIAGPFAEEMEGYLSELGVIGADPQACTVDWRKLACFSYWMAKMTPEQRHGTVEAIRYGSAMIPVCEGVMDDPAYGGGPMPTTCS
jgi:hypothetical protein